MPTDRSCPAQDGVAHVVRTVLLVARLGEADRRGWWGTQSFGAAGRVVLKQRLPRTWRMAATELDIAAAANRHDEVIDRPNAVHLFSDNWPVRRWTSAWVAEQKTADPPAALFEELESMPMATIVAGLAPVRATRTRDGLAVRLGQVPTIDLGSAEALAPLVSQLAEVYGESDRFVVPYFEVVE